MVIRLYYEEEIKKGVERLSTGGANRVSPSGETQDTHEVLGGKSGTSKASIGRLLPVYRNRLDLPLAE